MPIRLTDQLLYPNRGTTARALAFGVSRNAKRQAFLTEYLDELYRLCAKYGFDFALLVAQSVNETASWTSSIWQQYGNPAGIGVTGTDTSSGTNYSLVYANGKEAARAHLVHMWAYVRGPITSQAGEIADYIDLDPRYAAVLKGKDVEIGKPLAGSVKTLGDFNINGRWAELNNSQYGDNILKSGQAVWPDLVDQSTAPVTPPEPPEEPVSITFGRVPHPQYQQRIIQNSQAWNDLGARDIKAVVWHRMYGTLWGTDSYFRTDAVDKALTDYGVGVAATDGAANAGVILMWNDPNGRRSPWASGPVNNPIDDGAKFVNLYGRNAVNQHAVSIEISGESGSTALDAKARASIVALTAYYADQYGKRLAAKGKQFDYTTWPYIPSEDNRSFVMWHGEIYDGKRNSCPGAVVQAATDGMFAEIKAILEQYQSGGETVPEPPAPPVYATPQPPASGNSVVNGRYFLAHAQTYTLTKAVTPRIYADPGSDPTGPELPVGLQVTTTHVVSDVGASADLVLVLGETNINDVTIKTGSRIPAGVVFP